MFPDTQIIHLYYTIVDDPGAADHTELSFSPAPLLSRSPAVE
jgi:hypothetical protein